MKYAVLYQSKAVIPEPGRLFPDIEEFMPAGYWEYPICSGVL